MKIDPHSATWLNIKAHLDGRAEELRAKLESSCGWEDVLIARSALREIKHLLGLVRPVEAPLVETHLDIPS